MKITAELSPVEAQREYLDLVNALGCSAALNRVAKLSNHHLADILEHLNDALRRTYDEFGDTNFNITEDRRLCMLIRSDDNGHSFLIESGLDRAAANAAYQRVERGHKQMYEIISYQDEAERTKIIFDRRIQI